MPNILAAAADPHSWAKLMGIGSETLNTAVTAFLTTNRCDILNKLPAFIRVALSSNILQIKFSVSSFVNQSDSSGSDSSNAKGDWRKWIAIKNSTGNLILSLGYDNGPTANTPNVISYGSNFKLYVWDGAATPAIVTSFTLYNYRWPAGTSSNITDPTSEVAIDRDLAIAVSIDTTTPSNSFVTILTGGVPTTISGSQLHRAANMNLGQVTIGEFITGAASTFYLRLYAAYIVFSDYIDYTLKAIPFKPSAFGSVNDFTGLISTVTAWSQDKNYLATSVEVGAATSFILTKPTVSGNFSDNYAKNYNAVKQIDNYMMAHYLQTGGTSISFTVALYIGNTQASDLATVVIPANESDDKYLVKKVSTVVTSLISSGAFTMADIANLRVRITLIGV